MNDLRSPLEDRPYRPASPQYAPQYTNNPDGLSAKFARLRQHRFFPLGSVIAAVIVFGGIISYAYDQGSQTGVNATTPIVQASTDDYKTKPENPGGMDVPFQDAVVFDQLQSNQTASNDTVESLLPAPEQPVATTDSAAATADATATTTTDTATVTETPAASTTMTTTAEANTTPAVPQTPAPATGTTTTETPATMPSETMAVSNEPVKAPATAPAKTTTTNDAIAAKMDQVAPAATAPAAKIEGGSYRIQLGAFSDQSKAQAAWTKFKNQFHSQLANVTPDFPRADLPKGTFYRVQGTNLSKASADQICGQINAAKAGSCIVTK